MHSLLCTSLLTVRTSVMLMRHRLNVRQHLRDKRQAISMFLERPANISFDSGLPEGALPGTDLVSPVSSCVPYSPFHEGIDTYTPRNSFFTLLGRKHRPSSVGPTGILITREVIVDGELSFDDGGALTSTHDAYFCASTHMDKHLTRSHTV